MNEKGLVSEEDWNHVVAGGQHQVHLDSAL